MIANLRGVERCAMRRAIVSIIGCPTQVSRLVTELNAELASDDTATVAEAQRLCRLLSRRAAERLGLIVVGLQAASVAQIVLSCVTIVKGAGVVGTGDLGITAEPVAE
jgi:hypothetical protein